MYIHKSFLSIALISVLNLPLNGFASPESLTCSSNETKITVIDANDDEKKLACIALKRSITFFETYNFHPKTDVTIKFKNEVYMPLTDPTTTSNVRIVGSYNSETNIIEMTSLKAAWLRKRPYFGLTFNKELWVSVLTHEITHNVSKSLYSYQPNPKVHAQEEYIAYTAQLETMATPIRQKILKRFPKRDNTFSSEDSITDMVHYFDPHLFGVKSYYFHSDPLGGETFLQRIYSGDFKPRDISME